MDDMLRLSLRRLSDNDDFKAYVKYLRTEVKLLTSMLIVNDQWNEEQIMTTLNKIRIYDELIIEIENAMIVQKDNNND